MISPTPHGSSFNRTVQHLAASVAVATLTTTSASMLSCGFPVQARLGVICCRVTAPVAGQFIGLLAECRFGKFAEFAVLFQARQVHQQVQPGALVGLLTPEVLQRIVSMLTQHRLLRWHARTRAAAERACERRALTPSRYAERRTTAFPSFP